MHEAFSLPDFHCHLLPCMDDGSKSAQMTLAMLEEMAAQGIRQAVATPHFYPERDGFGRFLERRARSVELLHTVYDEARHPTLYLGAEVAYYHGISRSDRLSAMCIEGTRCLLLEMPFSRWSDDILKELCAMRDEQDLILVLAHIERYLSFQKRGTLRTLLREGFFIQSNAEFFEEKRTAKKALKMLARGEIHLLGSDCHNLDVRPPNLGAALEEIRQAGLSDLLSEMEERALRLLRDARPLQRD